MKKEKKEKKVPLLITENGGSHNGSSVLATSEATIMFKLVATNKT
jgi:hypothetical protein